MNKQRVSFIQLLTMNVGFFGVQFSFGLQQSNMSAIYKYLGANEARLPILWLAGPITGLLVQPIVGALSDRTWSKKFGRRKPYFFIGAIVASLALVFMPYSSSIFMAASLFWILDAANNLTLEPYRAFIADQLPSEQYAIGFLMQSFLIGAGISFANFMPSILVALGVFTLSDKMPNGIPISTYWAFGIGAVASIVTILLTIFTTSEYSPTDKELAEFRESKQKENIIKRTWNDIIVAFKEMPKPMRQLIPVIFFSWYAMFCYWQYLTSALSLSLYHTLDQKSDHFSQAQLLTGNLNGMYNIVCFVVAFTLIPITKCFGAKRLHCISLMLGGIGLLLMPLLNNTDAFLILPIGKGIPISQIYIFSFLLGIAWASMMSTPYQILAYSVPRNKMGVYMGVFNVFIVVSMIIQIFTFQFFVYDWLDHNPLNVIRLAGAFLMIGGIFSLFIVMD